jgi:hypothetical protein
LCGVSDSCRSLRVVFQNEDSSVVADLPIGPDGSVSAEMATGGFVTVVSTAGSSLLTFAGVAATDELLVAEQRVTTETRLVTVIAPTIEGRRA